ncbi:gamma-glutamyltransferase family protein [Aurantimonas sp. C2-6-R+9]|nr:gamma-glutamyltransferase family protein [Aurantimonas sp. C2-6-R+9]
MSARAFRNEPTTGTTYYPRLFGRRGAVTAEHYLSTDAGAEVLKAGGNAVDAAVAAVLVEGLVNPQMHTIGGECPMLISMAGSNRVISINGNTAAPERATPEAYRKRGFTDVPEEGILAAGVPAAFGALITALTHFGRLPFTQVAAPAIALARDGFPAHAGLIQQEKFGIRDLAAKFRGEWAGSAEVYLPYGKVPGPGDILHNRALAAMFEHLGELERHAGGDRAAGLSAVHDGFYKGDIATEIAKFSSERDGLLSRSDMERFETFLEDPQSIDFAGTTLFKCGFWTQGPTVLQALAMLEPMNLAALGHNSAEYLHTLIETVKLVYADREQYYGDPQKVNIPATELLSRDYAALRADLIDAGSANAELRPGDPKNGQALLSTEDRLGGRDWGPGTVHVDVIDSEGNMVAATPSGAWIKSAEVVPALGFPLGNRLMTFYIDPPQHPNRVAPFKRPRTTISPSLAFREGKPWMVFGSMGGDQQDQWQLQFFLNCVSFGMTIQQAIEAPKFSSEHFPGFFAPHTRFPNRVRIEPRVGEHVLQALSERGHQVEVAADWSEGFLLAAARNFETGVLEAGCDPRSAKSEIFPASALCW